MVLGALVVGLGWATYDFGMTLAGFRRLEADRALAKLNETIARQQQEIAELKARRLSMNGGPSP